MDTIICDQKTWNGNSWNNVCHQWKSTNLWWICYFCYVYMKKKRHFLSTGTFFSTAKPPNLGIVRVPLKRVDFCWKWWSAAGSVTRSVAHHKTGIVQVALDSWKIGQQKRVTKNVCFFPSITPEVVTRSPKNPWEIAGSDWGLPQSLFLLGCFWSLFSTFGCSTSGGYVMKQRTVRK